MIKVNKKKITDSVRCVVGVRHQAVTQVQQLGAGSVLAWMTAGSGPAYRNAERGRLFFSETCRLGTDCEIADCIGTGCPQFSSALVVNAIQHRREWLQSHCRGRTSGGKKVKERENGWGSKFGTTKCRTIYISEFQNCEY